VRVTAGLRVTKYAATPIDAAIAVPPSHSHRYFACNVLDVLN
jgi:hypothetical protein